MAKPGGLLVVRTSKKCSVPSGTDSLKPRPDVIEIRATDELINEVCDAFSKECSLLFLLESLFPSQNLYAISFADSWCKTIFFLAFALRNMRLYFLQIEKFCRENPDRANVKRAKSILRVSPVIPFQLFIMACMLNSNCSVLKSIKIWLGKYEWYNPLSSLE